MIVRKKYVITLTLDERQQLEAIRDRGKKPYMRECCAAILKVAAGYSPHYVAQHCLLKQRDPDTVYGWVRSYLKHGIDGLYRKAYHRDTLSADEKKMVEEMLHRPPHLFGQPGNRWTLEKVKAAFQKFASYTFSGIWRLLKRLKLTYKRGRLHITSPDKRYNEKKEWMQQAKDDAIANPDYVVTLYGDEKTYHRNPTVSCCAYDSVGTNQPTGISTPGKNTQRRIGAVMNIVDASIWYKQRSTFGVKALVNEMTEVSAWVCSCHPQVKEINLIWDCWSCHYHPDVLLAAHRAGITLIPLPTYAPWENPIEKLWRWLCQEVLHMHHCADAWRTLWKKVDEFLTPFEKGSLELLQYVGLLPKN